MRKNMVVSGGTGSGKTTLLNVLSNFIPATDRIVTIEDAAELRLPIEHKVRLETKPKRANEPDSHEVNVQDLMINALRMRPDRIIVGETRGKEAFDMIQAMNTGHEGSMTTVHANSPRDALMRLENMISMGAATMTSKAVKERICSALDLIVMVSRLDDGSRKVTHITEVNGMEGEVISTQDLFTFEEAGKDEEGKIKGQHKKAQLMPMLAKKCAKFGYLDDLNNIFALAGMAKPGNGGFGGRTAAPTPPPPSPQSGGFGIFGKSTKS